MLTDFTKTLYNIFSMARNIDPMPQGTQQLNNGWLSGYAEARGLSDRHANA